MGAAVAVVPSTKEVASSPTVAQTASSGAISKGVPSVTIVVSRNPNAYITDHHQYFGKPSAPDAHTYRELTY